MPWKETHAVSEGHHLVDLVVHNGIAISQAARSLGISRKTAHKWLARYDKRGRDALTDQSRARHTQSHLHPALAGADVSNALHGLPHLQWTSNHTNQLAGQLCTPNLGKFSLRTPLLRANRKAAARRSARKVGLPAFRGQVDYTASCRVIAGEMRVCRAALFLSEFASEFASAHHMKPSLAIKQAVGYQRVQVRMKVEIFAESVDRHDDGWNAIVRRVANAACIAERITQKVTHALMRDAAELLEQSAVKSKVRPQHLWDRECEVSMRHRREDRLRKHRAKYLHLLLMA